MSQIFLGGIEVIFGFADTSLLTGNGGISTDNIMLGIFYSDGGTFNIGFGNFYGSLGIIIILATDGINLK